MTVRLHHFLGTTLALLAVAACTLVEGTARSDGENPMVLWYRSPATVWEEALPIGNGRLGAMIYGGAGEETIQLNEATVWSGEPGNNLTPGLKERLPAIRQLIDEQRYSEAQALAQAYLPRHAEDNNYGMRYQPVGSIRLSCPGQASPETYRRELDIGNAVASVAFSVNGVNFRREFFSSLNDDVIVMRLSADKPGSIDCEIGIESPHAMQSVATLENELWLRGTSGDYENKQGKIKFSTIIHPELKGGELFEGRNTLKISGADSVDIYVSIATNFRAFDDISGDADAGAEKRLSKALGKDYAVLRSEHVREYKNYFDRVHLNLGNTASIGKPTDERLAEFNSVFDPQLVALYFQYGRYLLIASSQPGTQAANLQGIWNREMAPPWDSKYTLNINTEMNYWPAEVTNLTELNQPLFEMIRDLSITGRDSARIMYGARGWNVHHNTDIWRISGVVDGAYYGLWPNGGAWLSQHLWQHYLFTGDAGFLEDVYPVLEGVALFYIDTLQEDPKTHWMVVNPSMSPENAHHENTTIAAGTTMDNQLVHDVFDNYVEASRILGREDETSRVASGLLQRLAPMQIGRWGQLQEWMHDWDKQDDKHRHVSHLYGLYPSNQISPYTTPELFSAARISLEARGDQSTGWSMGWKVNLWARLLNGERAFRLISDQLRPVSSEDGQESGGTYPNLFDAHPPFQIDGNFGCTAGIAEMLLQSHDGAVHVLPALPAQWPQGEVSGLKARGGFELAFNWRQGEVETLKVESTLGGNLRLRSYTPLQGAGLMPVSGGSGNPNWYFRKGAKTPILVNSETSPSPPRLKPVFEYDIATEPGRVVYLRKK